MIIMGSIYTECLVHVVWTADCTSPEMFLLALIISQSPRRRFIYGIMLNSDSLWTECEFDDEMLLSIILNPHLQGLRRVC